MVLLTSPKAMSRVQLAVLLLLTTIPALYGQCVQDYRSSKRGGILVEHVSLSGTQSVSSDEMAAITSGVTGSCFDEGGGEVGGLIRDEFQQRGYFQVKVTSVRVEAVDPLAIPKPVDVKADVVEGQIFRLSDVVFSGNRAFPTQRLRAQFPVRVGDAFNTSRIRSGLDALRHLYSSEGYLDFETVPETELHSDQTVTLKLTVTEGKQYRMGKLKIAAQPEQAEALEARWSLREGVTYDAGYLQKFVEDSKDLLPSGFNEWNGTVVERDCRDATVSVSIILDKRLIPSQRLEHVGCDKNP